ncbi:hypothetical protein HYH03_005169 [Edaphochlamys debaryana]|uniref:Uncharacterized protein n=1 Tax=Edaphochlamys debaryana TaxID=47281 RepID=A0A835YDE3_9CHLO|nr:hypothetical protein HYH03_005169 [Edaphochlamys debaryana]|eukprot:KAG2496760.1 hypothetical protein HYH03_005169 [Edaphochlamys debaryana]
MVSRVRVTNAIVNEVNADDRAALIVFANSLPASEFAAFDEGHPDDLIVSFLLAARAKAQAHELAVAQAQAQAQAHELALVQAQARERRRPYTTSWADEQRRWVLNVATVSKAKKVS